MTDRGAACGAPISRGISSRPPRLPAFTASVSPYVPGCDGETVDAEVPAATGVE